MTPRKSPIPIERMATAARPVVEAIGLPPDCYTDPAFYEFELEAVFDNEWMCVGRTSQIPEPGDFFTTTLVGREPVIVARNRNGRINVMSSICQHRAMCITAPDRRPRGQWFDEIPECSGNTRNFRCPYHWWTYDLDGRLVGAPEMRQRPGFQRSDISLPKLTVDEWQGFVFCSFSRDAEPLGPRLASFDEILEPYDFDQLVTSEPEVLDLPFNWKIMAENTMDGYHSARLHAAQYDFDQAEDDDSLISGDFPSLDPSSAGLGGQGRASFRDRGMNPTQKALFPPMPGLTDEQRWNVAYLFVPPTLAIGVHSDSAQWLVWHPTGPASCRLTMGFLFPESTTKLKLFDQLYEQHRRGFERFLDEDMPVGLGNQLGMGSRYAIQGPLSHQDFLKAQFAEWLVDRYRSADAESRVVQPDISG